jgi:hypothetical protein
MPPKQARIPFQPRDQPTDPSTAQPTTASSIGRPVAPLARSQSRSPNPLRSASPASFADSKTPVRTSWVFFHMPDDDKQTQYFNDVTGVMEWRCRYCNQVYAISGSVSGPASHLTKKHELPNGSTRSAKAANVQKSLEEGFAAAVINQQKRKRADRDTIEQDKLEALWVRAVASCNLSFRLVENNEFRAFLRYLNQDAEDLLAYDHRTVKEWVVRQYMGLKEQLVIPTIQKARSKIHVSCDLWTSPNSLAILGITAQFINESWGLQRLVLGMREVVGEHTGLNSAKYIH